MVSRERSIGIAIPCSIDRHGCQPQKFPQPQCKGVGTAELPSTDSVNLQPPVPSWRLEDGATSSRWRPGRLASPARRPFLFRFMPFFNDFDFHALDARTTLPAYRCHGHNYLTMGLFCEALSLYPRTHSLRHRFLLRQARARRKIPKAVRRRVPRFGKSAEAVRATKTPCRPLLWRIATATVAASIAPTKLRHARQRR